MEIPGRETIEARLARELAKLQQAQMTRLLEYLGDPPKIENVPPEFWAEVGAELQAVLSPFVQKLFLAQAANLLASQTIGVDWTLINTAAVDWANRYTFDLVRGINQTTQDLLRKAVGNFYSTPGTTLQNVVTSLQSTFGPVRAEMISVTEITRAAEMGENEVVSQIIRDNPSLTRSDYWSTNRDDRVCPICGGLDKQRAVRYNGITPVWVHPQSGQEFSIPAHPRCRCSKAVRFEVVER